MEFSHRYIYKWVIELCTWCRFSPVASVSLLAQNIIASTFGKCCVILILPSNHKVSLYGIYGINLEMIQRCHIKQSQGRAYNVLRILTSTGSSSVISWWPRFYWRSCTTESCPIKIISCCCLRPITEARFKVTGLVAFVAWWQNSANIVWWLEQEKNFYFKTFILQNTVLSLSFTIVAKHLNKQRRIGDIWYQLWSKTIEYRYNRSSWAVSWLV